MNGKMIGLCAAAVALPLSVLAPAAAEATTGSATAVSGSSAVVSNSTVAAKSHTPRVALWDYEYNEDDDYFDIQVKYKCYKYHGSKKGTVEGWVVSDDGDSYYYGKARGKCDGRYHKTWVEAELYDGYYSLSEGDYTIYASVTDKHGNYNYDYDTDSYEG